MLVLTRKLMEKLFIGDDICVTVVRIEGGQVRLGIEAPRDVAVVRSELVPDRQSTAPPRASSMTITNGGNAGGTPSSSINSERTEIRIPQALVHGIGSRRRGRSQ